MARTICLLCALVLLASAAAQPEALYRYWPRFPRPTTLIVVPFVGDHEEGMAFETAAGLAARAVLQGRGDAMLLEDVRNTGYIRWRAGMEKLVQPRCIDVADTWDAIARLRDAGLVRGYVLYRYDANARGFHEQGPIDESVNVATSICSLVDGVAVSERLQQRAEALGLQLLADVRERDEAWCLQQYGDRLSRGLLTMADPKSRVARHLGVALEALTLSRPGPVHDAAEKLWEQQFEGWLHSFEDYLTDNARTRGMYAAYRGLNQATCRLWLNGEIEKEDARQILMKAQKALITEVGPLLGEGAGTHPATATP